MREALERVWSRPRVVMALAALNLLLTVVAARPLSAVLQPAIDARPGAAGLLGGDDGLYLELFADNPAVTRVAASGAMWVVLLYGLLAWLLAGGILATLAQPRPLDPRAGVRGILSTTAEHAWRMLKVGLASLPFRLAPLVLATGVVFALRPLLGYRGFRELGWGVIILGIALGFFWSLTTVAIDYARALVLADPALGTWRALARGCKRVCRTPRTSATIAAFSVGALLTVTALYHVIAYRLPNAPAWAFALLTLLRLGIAYLRAAINATTLIAAGLAARPT